MSPGKPLRVVFLLFVAIKLSIVLSLFSSVYTAFIWKQFQPNQSNDFYNTVFYSYPIFLAILFTSFRPKLFGWSIGKVSTYWRMTLFYTLLIILPVLAYLNNAPKTPFHGMSWQVYILAPIGEEAVFRGAFFMAIYYILKQVYPDNPDKISFLTILFSAIAFGMWHLPNITVEPTFTIFQIIYTTLIGMILGHIRYRTESLYPGIFIHFLINLLATLM